MITDGNMAEIKDAAKAQIATFRELSRTHGLPWKWSGGEWEQTETMAERDARLVNDLPTN